MHYVYVLQSLKDKQLYTGYTKDLKARIKQHNAGYVYSTKMRGPLKLVYYEAYLSQKDATAKEKFLKTGWGRNYLKKYLANSVDK